MIGKVYRVSRHLSPTSPFAGLSRTSINLLPPLNGYSGWPEGEKLKWLWIHATWAHLKREFQAIKERGGKSAEIGEGLLTEVGKLFERWYELRENRIDWPAFQAAMKPIEQRVGELLRAGEQCD